MHVESVYSYGQPLNLSYILAIHTAGTYVQFTNISMCYLYLVLYPTKTPLFNSGRDTL